MNLSFNNSEYINAMGHDQVVNRQHLHPEEEIPGILGKYGSVESHRNPPFYIDVTKYGGVAPEVIKHGDIIEVGTHDSAVSDFSGELKVDKGSSIENSNSQIKIKNGGGWFRGSSVSSNENLTTIEKTYLQQHKMLLVNNMNNLKGQVSTKNLAETASTLSDLAQAGLTRWDARTFQNLSNELQSVVDKAQTFNNYSFKEGDKSDLEGKLDSDKTLAYLKSDSGKAVLEELGINANNLDSIKPDVNGNINIGDKIIQLSEDKLSVTEPSKKWVASDTYETSTYELDDKFKPDMTETNKNYFEDEPYQKYHTDTKFTNLHEKDEYGKNIHLPEGLEISTAAMEGRLNEWNDSNGEFAKKLSEATGKDADDLKCYANHAYYIDENGTEHQFYYDEKNDKFINSNVTPNEEQGGYDVEVNVPKNQSEDVSKEFEKLSDDDKKFVMELLKKIKAGYSEPDIKVRETDKFSNPKYETNLTELAKSEFEKMQKDNPNVDSNLLNIAVDMAKKS